MPSDNEIETNIEAYGDDKQFAISCDLSANPIELPWGASLLRYQLLINREGILMGYLELSGNTTLAASGVLSVSPEYPVTLG